MNARRYHGLIILYKLLNLIRTAAFPTVFLFVINNNSQSPLIIYGRYAFILFLVGWFLHIVIEWYSNTYELDGVSFSINKGVFNKTQQTIPFSKIQNVSRHTSLFHKLFGLTSIRFETSMTGNDATAIFEVISKAEADRIEKVVSQPVVEDDNNGVSPEAESLVFKEKNVANRTVHFRPTKTELVKASFTSLSFLVLIPVLLSIYDHIGEIFNAEKRAKGLLSNLLDSWLVIGAVLTILVITSVAFGIVRTFLKYGNYEISSDDERIYISKGIVDETAFSISKERVQAIEITQSPIKRILGLAEVKLTSAGDIVEDENSQDINSLFPFLPVKRAVEMVSEILPSYQVTDEMKKLPKKSWAVRMLRPSWLWMIAAFGLFIWNPSFLGEGQTWWILAALFLLLVVVSRVLDTMNTRFVLNERFIQIKKGWFTTTLFVSKRDKIIEIEVSRGPLQKLLGLASIGTVNRAKPVHHNGIDDIPQEIAAQFYTWYIGRHNEIEVR